MRTSEDYLSVLIKDPSEQSSSLALFHLLSALSRVRKIQKHGGYYLEDRDGENLIILCFDTFRSRLYEHLSPDPATLSAVLDHIKPDDSLSTFQATFLRPENAPLKAMLQDLGKNLVTWAKVRSQDFELLFLYAVLLDFEVNRIYFFWYGNKEPFPFDKQRERLVKIFGPDGQLAKEPTVLLKYAKKILGVNQYLRLKRALSCRGGRRQPVQQQSDAG